MAVRYASAKHLRRRTRRLGGLLDDPGAVVGIHRGVAIAMENDGRHGRFAIRNCFGPPCRIATIAEGRSVAAPQARPECMPTDAYRSGYFAPMTAAAAPPADRPAT